MFFKKTVLKRMLKSAYTGAGLTVGHTPETDEEMCIRDRLSIEQKNKISHRGKALEQMKNKLKELYGGKMV